MALASSTRTISNWSDNVLQRKNNKIHAIAGMASAPTNIWRSRISWRIALSVFLTILVVQGGILFFTFKQEEMKLLTELQDQGLAGLAPSIGEAPDMLTSPISTEQAERITSTSVVRGFAIYSLDLRFLGSHGAPVSMVMVDQDSIDKTYRSVDGSYYEIVYKPSDLRKSYFIVARLDSRHVAPSLLDYINQTVAIMLLMSAFVTVVLMISLSKWLLEPILFMRDNLMAASANPESPEIAESPFNVKDEIGGAISMTQDLIRQNADNIKQIKSAAEDKIHKLAYYDQLTGLPNRIQIGRAHV